MVQPEATVFTSFQDSTSYLVLPRPSLAVFDSLASLLMGLEKEITLAW